MSKQEIDGQKWIFIFLGVFLLLFLSRVLFRFIWVLLLAGLAFGIYFGIKALMRRYRDKQFQKTTEGQIHARLLYCREQIQRNKEESQEVEQSIQDLEEKLNQNIELNPQSKDETNRLIEAFESELKLRKTKIAFFQTCEFKLQQMLNNFGYTKSLDAQKEKLRKLQENHFEDLAQMEELKSGVEMDVLYLDTIEKLSQRITESTNTNDAEQVRMELETMTNDLEDFDRDQ